MISPKVEPAKVPSQVCLMPEPVVKTLWSVVLWPFPSSKTLEARKSRPLGLLEESWRLAFSGSRTWISLVSLIFPASDGDCCSVGSRSGVGKASQEGGEPPANPTTSLPTTPSGWSPKASLLPWSNFCPGNRASTQILWSSQPSPLFQLHGALSAKLWGSPESSEDVSGHTRPHSAWGSVCRRQQFGWVIVYSVHFLLEKWKFCLTNQISWVWKPCEMHVVWRCGLHSGSVCCAGLKDMIKGQASDSVLLVAPDGGSKVGCICQQCAEKKSMGFAVRSDLEPVFESVRRGSLQHNGDARTGKSIKAWCPA